MKSLKYEQETTKIQKYDIHIQNIAPDIKKVFDSSDKFMNPP